MCLVQTGKGLLAYSSMELHSIAAYLSIEAGVQTKEEHEARDATIGNYRQIDREHATGMPAVTEIYRPADEMYGEV